MSAELLFRRLLNVLGFGRNTAPSDESGTVQHIQITLQGGELRDTVSLQLYGFFSSVPKGADHLVVFAQGDRSKGVVIASNHQSFRPKNQAPGNSGLHDAFGGIVILSAGGIAITPAPGDGTGTVTINGNLHVTGAIAANGDVTGAGISLDHHVHGGVQGGSSNTAGPH